MRNLSFYLAIVALLTACNEPITEVLIPNNQSDKIVIYQVFTRLFGNTNTTNKPWGSLAENGVGKFADFTDKALDSIKALGITHIWYTGVPHHALIADYKSIGISDDDPDVVKGRAGSPYAVKDYYNVNPDLATDPANRLQEFKELIGRTHQHNMQVIIDIVPNHIARSYQSLNYPDSIQPFGIQDDTTVEYSRNNSFYYIPGQSFKVPKATDGYKPLGGEINPLADGLFGESPAKWTGNGSRLAQPNINDWYETVKVNYGIKPDGSKDFTTLPNGYDTLDAAAHYLFWKNKDVPASWVKFKDIALFWLSIGVDGFRFDMAEMVPVEFWSYLNATIKHYKANAVLVAEVYNPAEYRNYIHVGKMDYLYDKVALYDTLKHIIQGHGSTDNIVKVQKDLADIEHHMLHFLENHDEHRIASPQFAGDPLKALPGMVLSATISTSPTLLYFAQELGEPGAENAGFGQPGRTSIFDYVGVPSHQRWMNNGAFDGGLLSTPEKHLRSYYAQLFKIITNQPAFGGKYLEIHSTNRGKNPAYNDKLFAFVRYSDKQKLLIINNFSHTEAYNATILIPNEVVNAMGLEAGSFQLKELLNIGSSPIEVTWASNSFSVPVNIPALGSFIIELP